MENVQYKQYYVAFLDILGFKELVNSPYTTCQNIHKIYTAFGDMQRVYFGEEYGETQDVKMKVMSDSICLYIEVDKPNALYSLLAFCMAFQYDLLTLSPSIFIRGGITSGNMYVKDDIIFGPALTEAYLLEENNSKVPRIIIRKSTLDQGAAKADSDKKENVYFATFLDDDAFYTVNYFLLLCDKNRNTKVLNRVQETVSRFLDTAIDESIRQKYLYIDGKINKFLSKVGGKSNV